MFIADLRIAYLQELFNCSQMKISATQKITIVQMQALVLNTATEICTLIGQRLRALRLSNNLSQTELAARAGVSLMMLRRLESGGEGPLLAWVKLLQALHALDVLESITDPPDATITTIAALEQRALVDGRQRASRPRKTSKRIA